MQNQHVDSSKRKSKLVSAINEDINNRITFLQQEVEKECEEGVIVTTLVESSPLIQIDETGYSSDESSSSSDDDLEKAF